MCKIEKFYFFCISWCCCCCPVYRHHRLFLFFLLLLILLWFVLFNGIYFLRKYTRCSLWIYSVVFQRLPNEERWYWSPIALLHVFTYLLLSNNFSFHILVHSVMWCKMLMCFAAAITFGSAKVPRLYFIHFLHFFFVLCLSESFLFSWCFGFVFFCTVGCFRIWFSLKQNGLEKET